MREELAGALRRLRDLTGRSLRELARDIHVSSSSLQRYFGTKHVQLVISSTAAGAGPPRTYENLDELVADVENARVWGGLHYRTTMTKTARRRGSSSSSTPNRSASRTARLMRRLMRLLTMPSRSGGEPTSEW